MKQKNQILVTLGSIVMLTLVGLIKVMVGEQESLFSQRPLVVAITTTIVIITMIMVATIINRILIWVAQFGQHAKQKISFITSLYATSLSQVPFAIINLFLVMVLNLYKIDNQIAGVLSSITTALLYIIILQSAAQVSKRTVTIYIFMSLFFAIVMMFLL